MQLGEFQGLLYTIEQCGEIHHFMAADYDATALIKKSLSKKPYIELAECGTEIDLERYASIQHSTDFVCELEFNFDEHKLRVYRVVGNIPEIDRNDSNCVFKTYTFDELKTMVESDSSHAEKEHCQKTSVFGSPAK